MKTLAIIMVLATAFLLIGCGTKQVIQQPESSPTIEAEEIGNELASDELNTDDLDGLDSELDSLDSDLEDF